MIFSVFARIADHLVRSVLLMSSAVLEVLHREVPILVECLPVKQDDGLSLLCL